MWCRRLAVPPCRLPPLLSYYHTTLLALHAATYWASGLIFLATPWARARGGGGGRRRPLLGTAREGDGDWEGPWWWRPSAGSSSPASPSGCSARSPRRRRPRRRRSRKVRDFFAILGLVWHWVLILGTKVGGLVGFILSPGGGGGWPGRNAAVLCGGKAKRRNWVLDWSLNFCCLDLISCNGV